jgi:protein-tyrosine phosphatase
LFEALLKTDGMQTDGAPVTRILPIVGSHNLRDMGGYQTGDGRRVKWRTLFRSGVMAGLTEADRGEFCHLGVAAIYDLRANHERERRPTQWHVGGDIEYYSRDHELSVGALDELIAHGEPLAHTFTDLIHAAYREFPYEQADSLRELFRLLIAGRVPLLFNCTAGKDRTGVAAALILFALGVPRETIDLDYALTDLSIDKLLAVLSCDSRYGRLASLPREHVLPLLRADPEYLAVAFREIERRHGNLHAYLDAILGVGKHEIAALRDVLLT